jgi:hypothetical protein
MRVAPPRYTRYWRPGTTVIARDDVADAVREAMERGSLYDWAANHPERRVLQGRLYAYAAPLPRSGPRVVVRRNAHGGALASWRGDRFLFPRAPFELAMSLVLTELGVPTAEVVAYAMYRANLIERRSDVATLELPPGLDLGAALLEPAPADRRAARWNAVGALLRRLAEQGVWHQDLNVKNVYLIEEGDSPPRAAILDVDRARLVDPGRGVAQVNSARLRRSLRKWEVARGAKLRPDELSALDVAAALS